MALIDLECTDPACAVILENHPRAAADWQTTPPCAACGAPTTRIFLPPRTAWSIDPILAFRAPDGTFRFPGDAGGSSVGMYEKLGYERVELRSAADVRRFEKQVETQQGHEESRRVESRHQQRERREGESRGELFRRMKTMSNWGRDLAHAAIARGNDRSQERSRGAGFHVEVMSQDRSNREASRDARGHRRRD